MPGLLYPAYQKFYSAIRNLEQFEKEGNFFDNISSLDGFLTEYRSITFVMQKSLAHTSYINKYNELINLDILDSWLNKQRIKSVHQHPTEFNKEIKITVYFPDFELPVGEYVCTLETDKPLNTVLDGIKDFFAKINPIEIFFSANFSFVEKDTGENFLQKISSAINAMKLFMELMEKEICENCILCEQLKAKINESKFSLLPVDFYTINDYVYFPQKNQFVKADKLALVLNGSPIPTKSPLSGLNKVSSDSKLSYFEKFILLNAKIGTTDLMPTIVSVYDDDTFSIDTYHSSIKTVTYRKLNETAKNISSGKIKEIYFMMTYLTCEVEYLALPSCERQANATSEYLAFMMVDCSLNQKECIFDKVQLKDTKNILNHVKINLKNKLDIGANNMSPIIEAFSNLKKN